MVYSYGSLNEPQKKKFSNENRISNVMMMDNGME